MAKPLPWNEEGVNPNWTESGLKGQVPLCWEGCNLLDSETGECGLLGRKPGRLCEPMVANEIERADRCGVCGEDWPNTCHSCQ